MAGPPPPNPARRRAPADALAGPPAAAPEAAAQGQGRVTLAQATPAPGPDAGGATPGSVRAEAGDPPAAPPVAEEFGPPTAPSAARPAPGPATSVVTDRLPRIGAAPRAEVGEAALIEATDRRPIDRFARPFDNPGNRPALAVVLIDDGDPALDRSALARLPFPVTFALDPMAPEAADRAAIYRAAGQEVVMLATGIPPGAEARDLEVTFAALAGFLPEAVAVLDLPEGGMQGNRALAAQVVTILQDQGRGLLSWDQGLNAADQVARRAGLPAAVLFRRFDASGSDPAAIRRSLDRAVFRAGQIGQVAVAGTASAATVAALVAWTVEGRAASVALAPVTALMRAD
jgi:hypothetical protein